MVFLNVFLVLHKGRKILIMFIALLRSKSVYLRHFNKNGYILQNLSLLKLPGSLHVEAYFIVKSQYNNLDKCYFLDAVFFERLRILV